MRFAARARRGISCTYSSTAPGTAARNKKMRQIRGSYFVYILECADTTLYTGITTNLDRRLKEHQGKKGARYTRAHGALKIIYSEVHLSQSQALKREAKIKKMRRVQKIALAKI